MTVYKKESLETLRQRVDLVEVLSSYVDLKRTGASYKGLCPFHDEKSPSFIIQKGDSHYHCFGCGAHGDSIHFLMNHQKMSFSEAVESLADRFKVPLEKVEGQFDQPPGPDKKKLKGALEDATQFYHFYLLHTEEGHQALEYLYERGIDLDFIRYFRIGLSPTTTGIFRKALHSKFVSDETLLDAGLLSLGKDGKSREFFNARIMFPIQHHSGEVIGFSGRKLKEETFGGKYINTPETVLFKKSRVLFGFNHSRRRIAKERRAIIVEGQVDALRLIYAGFNLTVAGQGTAFGEDHVKELTNLGISQVYLALDGDLAGQEATCKIGHLFQKEGVEVKILEMPSQFDPDTFLKSHGSEAFIKLMNTSIDYLSFLMKHLSKNLDLNSPAAKNEVIQKAMELIREWDHPVMVHETLRKLAHCMQVPEEMVGVGQANHRHVFVKTSGSIGSQSVDPDRILETDLLRWLLLAGQENKRLADAIFVNLKAEDLKVAICRKIFEVLHTHHQSNRSFDFLSLAIDLDDVEAQLVLAEIVKKKIKKEQAESLLTGTIQKVLDRNWLHKREEIKVKIQSGSCSEEEVFHLVKQFDALKRGAPQVT